MMTHRALRFTESNSLAKSTKAMYRLKVLFSGLLHKLTDSEDHIRHATVSAKAAL